MKKTIVLLALFTALLPSVFAASTGDATSRISGALCELYNMLRDLLTPLVVLAIVVAAVAYAGGNVLGQEIGAKAKSWAVNIIVYVGIGILVFVIVPYILQTVAPEFDFTGACA